MSGNARLADVLDGTHEKLHEETGAEDADEEELRQQIQIRGISKENLQILRLMPQIQLLKGGTLLYVLRIEVA
jgi:hypothetical protein